MYTDGIIKKENGKYRFPEGFVAKDERERKVMCLQNNDQPLSKELIEYMEKRKSGNESKIESERRSVGRPHKAIVSADVLG